MVNLGTGNLLVQNDDMDIPHKGIDLAYRRTYNSQSRHDVGGGDGTPPGRYGNGWTSTFDAHVSEDAAGHTVSVWDIDGARYDYALAADGVTWMPPAGQHATLTDARGCGLLWTKKTGTTYYFYYPQGNPTCGAPQAQYGAYDGLIYQIIGRNTNTALTFYYEFTGNNAGPGGLITNVTAGTESGLYANMQFADFSGHRLAQALSRPDGQVIWYDYDVSGNLTSVTSPGNNDAGTTPVQAYAYTAAANGAPYMAWTTSPRWNASSATDGGYLYFGFQSSGTSSTSLSAVGHVGFMNSVNDGLSAGPLQPGVTTGIDGFLTEYFTTTTTANGSAVAYSDSYNHVSNYVFDAAGRPLQTQECLTPASQQCPSQSYLISSETWDANNELIAEVDPRSNETDYAYDANGNTVAVAEPPPYANASRPTKLFAYDGYNNVTAYCDPVAAAGAGTSWNPPNAIPNAAACLASTAATRFTYDGTDSSSSVHAYEPFGRLSAMTTPGTPAYPGGYQVTYGYASAQQGGTDYGLPTSVTGSALSQTDAAATQTTDATTPTRQPQQSFGYDAHGRLTCYSKGIGTWVLAYDNGGRLVSAADPDDSTASPGTCSRSGTQPNWNTAVTTTYYPGGAVRYRQTPSQRANGVVDTIAYDTDGNEVSETHSYGCLTTSACTPGVTRKFYDGADRLVEVLLPYDGWDIQGYPWATRYIYDVEGHGVAYGGGALAGYGNLVATQELLSGTIWQPATQTVYGANTGSWTDVRATSYDPLDRPVASYEASFGGTPKERNWYDGSGQAGLLSSTVLATGESKNYGYDNIGRQTQVWYQNDPAGTPALTFSYDADGRVVRRDTLALGSEQLTYDARGQLTSVVEPASLGGGTIAYTYYADGMRSAVHYSDASQSFPFVASYAYRNDGLREQLRLSNGTSFRWTSTSAGRLLSQSDPLTGTTITPSTYYLPTGSKTEKPYYPASTTYVPKTSTYDQYGRLSALRYPANLFGYTFGTSQYDLEDGIAEQTETTYSPPGSVFPSSVAQCVRSNIRNEKVTAPFTGSCTDPSAFIQPVHMHGAELRTPQTQDYPAAQNWTLDARSSMLLHDTATTTVGTTIGPAYAYDASGRLTQDVDGRQETLRYNSSSHASFSSLWCPEINLTSQNPTVTCFANGTRQKTYDAENHLRSETFSFGNPATTSYGAAHVGGFWQDTSGYGQPASLQSIDYGADSHPKRLSLYHPDPSGVYPASETRAWLWDGQDRFIECQLAGSQCQSLRISLEGLGDYDPASQKVIRVNDRDRTGLVGMSRTSAAFSSLIAAPRVNLYKIPVSPCSSSQGPAIDPAYLRADDICTPQHDGKLSADGWTLDYETWQGVRTYDGAVGQWNSPDAYAGEVHDPLSQKPFMWNRNNPFDYGDPSGYDPRFDAAIEAEILGGVEVGLSRGLVEKSLSQNVRAQSVADRLRSIKANADNGEYPTKPGSSGGPGSGRNFGTAAQQVVRNAGRCAACGRSGKLYGDHVHPKSRGGNNTPENLDALCLICNSSKGSSTPEEWLKRLFGPTYVPPVQPTPIQPGGKPQ